MSQFHELKDQMQEHNLFGSRFYALKNWFAKIAPYDNSSF